MAVPHSQAPQTNPNPTLTKNMRRHLLLVLSLLPGPVLLAQTVTATATVLSGTATATGTGAPVVRTANPNAPVPMSLSAVATAPVVVAVVSSTMRVDNSVIELRVNQTAYVGSLGTASADADLQLSLTSTLPLNARLELVYSMSILPVGAVPPTVQLDVDADGIFETIGRVNQTVTRTLNLSGPVAPVLRVRSTNTGASPGSLGVIVYLRLLPDHPNVSIRTLVLPCTALDLIAEQTFAAGVRFRPATSGGFRVLVLGFSPVFQTLPVGQNCFLVPNPDIVVTNLSAPVAVPAALGPLSFYAQAIFLDPMASSSGASTAYFVQL
ncbi:MAG: hypothetical protein IPK26_02685 [Planctomycetes bacterium]|nr:hypothetical protein [Planctomycetota bacterium]